MPSVSCRYEDVCVCVVYKFADFETFTLETFGLAHANSTGLGMATKKIKIKINKIIHTFCTKPQLLM